MPARKIKFASAEKKRQHHELEQSWQQLLKKHATGPVTKRKSSVEKFTVLSPSPPPGREPVKYPSLGMNGVATKSIHSVKYTGNNITGIGTLHKSNAVPVFSQTEAIEIARMRRS